MAQRVVDEVGQRLHEPSSIGVDLQAVCLRAPALSDRLILVAASTLFDVQLRLEAADPPKDAAELVTQALAEASPLQNVKGRAGVSTSDRGVTIRFDDVVASGQREGGAQVQDVLPVVQALINAIIERVATGTAPIPRLVIEVQPARPHLQEELRHA